MIQTMVWWILIAFNCGVGCALLLRLCAHPLYEFTILGRLIPFTNSIIFRCDHWITQHLFPNKTIWDHQAGKIGAVFERHRIYHKKFIVYIVFIYDSFISYREFKDAIGLNDSFSTEFSLADYKGTWSRNRAFSMRTTSADNIADNSYTCAYISIVEILSNYAFCIIILPTKLYMIRPKYEL